MGGTMDLQQIMDSLLEKISENQMLNGIKDSEILQETCPFQDLEKFDSMTALEVLVALESEIEEKLNREIDLNIKILTTPIIDEKTMRTKGISELTVKDIAINILKSIS